MSNYSITLVTTAADGVIAMPAVIANHVRVVCKKRNPARTFVIDVPASQWPNTDDVPTAYRELVRGSLLDSASKILAGYTGNPARDQAAIPASMFTLEALISQTTSDRMTSEALINLFRQSNKYVFSIAPKLTELAGSKLLAYKSRIERMEKRLAALCGRTPETKLSGNDLDNILVNLNDVDLDTPFGEFVAVRCEEVRAKLSEDSEAL